MHFAAGWISWSHPEALHRLLLRRHGGLGALRSGHGLCGQRVLAHQSQIRVRMVKIAKVSWVASGHLNTSNIANWKIQYEWRFIAGKIWENTWMLDSLWPFRWVNFPTCCSRCTDDPTTFHLCWWSYCNAFGWTTRPLPPGLNGVLWFSNWFKLLELKSHSWTVAFPKFWNVFVIFCPSFKLSSQQV